MYVGGDYAGRFYCILRDRWKNLDRFGFSKRLKNHCMRLQTKLGLQTLVKSAFSLVSGLLAVRLSIVFINDGFLIESNKEPERIVSNEKIKTVFLRVLSA